MMKCRASKEKTLAGAFGERCGKPATKKDYSGRPVCDDCYAHCEKAKGDPKTIGSILSEIVSGR